MTQVTTLPAGSKLICPFCKTQQEDIVDDYVIPGKVGAASASSDSCYSCDAEVTVQLESDGAYQATWRK